jgi:hypothetical protein
MTTEEKYKRTDMNVEQKNGVATTTQDVLTHHLNCFGDITGTMADYTAESRFFTPDGLLRGSEAIRRFFVRLFEEFAKPLQLSMMVACRAIADDMSTAPKSRPVSQPMMRKTNRSAK